MSFRLYESAWVKVEGSEAPLQAHKDPLNSGVFAVGDFRYDIDARALPSTHHVPPIISILSLEAVRDAGLQSGYDRDYAESSKPGRRWFG